MKKILFAAAAFIASYNLGAQTLQPILTEIYDPGVNDKFQPASSQVDENGNTYLSMRNQNYYSGLMKLDAGGNIVWQKKLPYLYTENQDAYYNSYDAANLSYKQGDGLYFSTKEFISGMGAWYPVKFYLSKANPSSGSFYWHVSCKAEWYPSSRSMVVDAPNGVYWMFSNKVVNVSPTGVKLFSRSLAPGNVITTATPAPDGGCYMITHNDMLQHTALVKMSPAGNIQSSYTITDTSYVFSITTEPYSKMQYHEGHLYFSFGKDAGSGLIKMDTTGNILAIKKWSYAIQSVPYILKGGTWTIYKDKIVFSQTSINGPLESFSRLNIFSLFDLNLNEIQTFSIPHFSTYGSNSFSGTDPYFPEVFSVNGDYLQVAGSKGDSPIRNGNFLRVDSTFIFKECNNIIADSIPNVGPLAVFVSPDTLGFLSTNDTVSTFFPLSSNMPFATKRNDISIDTIQTTSGPCGSCNSSALAMISGETAVVYYDWGTNSGGQTNNPAVNLCPSTYNLTISDNYGCKDNATFVLDVAPPAGMDLCLTTVDSLSTHNILLWEKPVSSVLAGFNIYREITTNNFQFIAFVDYDSLSEYHDINANPNITNYRYKVTAVDTCGYESAASDYHSTIHLQLLGNGNMQWTLYDIEHQGNPVSFYNVYRDNLSDGNWTLLTGSLPGTNSTYTDINYNLYPNASYRVDVNWSISCTPTRTTINTTRSNIKSSALIGVDEADLNSGLNIYPNPANDVVVIEQVNIKKESLIIIYDAVGQEVFSRSTANVVEKINVGELAAGIYTISIQNETGKVFKKLVIQ